MPKSKDKRMAIVLVVSMLIWFPLLFVGADIYENKEAWLATTPSIYLAAVIVIVLVAALLTTYFAFFHFALSSTCEIIERGDVK